MKILDIEDFSPDFQEAFAIAEAGEAVLVLIDGKPACRLLPLDGNDSASEVVGETA